MTSGLSPRTPKQHSWSSKSIDRLWKGSRSRSVGALLLGGPALFASGCLGTTDPLPPVVEVPSSAIRALGSSDLLNRIIDLVPMDDGSVWILNGVDPFFVHLSPEGSVLETAGRAGQGLRLVEPDRGAREGHRWYRVRGGDLTLVEFPPLFEAMVFETGRLWGVYRDQLDRPVVAWLDLDFDEL